MMDLRDYSILSPPSEMVGDIKSYLSQTDILPPIDLYRRSMREILAYGTATRLRRDTFLGRLLLIGLVSAAEGYFRAVLSHCIEICPVAQAGAATKTINLGGLLWHGKEGFSRSAFEHASFASREELTKACRDYISFRLEDAIFKSPLEQFDAVCHLRHGIVHADGRLPGRNAVQLGVPRGLRPVAITVGYKELQQVAAVINTLVFTLNRELFKEMCRRWAAEWRKRPDWSPSEETARFDKIWDIFHSADECALRRDKAKVTKRKCLSDVRALFLPND